MRDRTNHVLIFLINEGLALAMFCLHFVSGFQVDVDVTTSFICFLKLLSLDCVWALYKLQRRKIWRGVEFWCSWRLNVGISAVFLCYILSHRQMLMLLHYYLIGCWISAVHRVFTSNLKHVAIIFFHRIVTSQNRCEKQKFALSAEKDWIPQLCNWDCGRLRCCCWKPTAT